MASIIEQAGRARKQEAASQDSGCTEEMANMRQLLALAERKQNQLRDAADRLKAQKGTEAANEILAAAGCGSSTSLRLLSPSRSEVSGFSDSSQARPSVVVMRPHSPGSPLARSIGFAATSGVVATPWVGASPVLGTRASAASPARQPGSAGGSVVSNAGAVASSSVPSRGSVEVGRPVLRQTPSQSLFDALDKNGDGVITREEFEAQVAEGSIVYGSQASPSTLPRSTRPLISGASRTSFRARTPTQAGAASVATPTSPQAASFGVTRAVSATALPTTPYTTVPTVPVTTVTTAHVPVVRAVTRQASGSVATPVAPLPARSVFAGISQDAIPVGSTSWQPGSAVALPTTSSRGILSQRTETDASPISSTGRHLPQHVIPSWKSPIPFMLDILQGKRIVARGRVYLYQAPFAPSVRYTNGGEYFVLPRGWAIMRSRQGLLVWVELLEDGLLQEFVRELVTGDQSSPTRGLRAGPSVRAGSPYKRPISQQLLLSLPTPAGGILGQLEIRSPRACTADLAVRVSCEDSMVLHPTLAVGSDAPEAHLGLRATLGPVAGSTSGFDELIKAWLSALEVQV